ncbi:MAG: phosphoribosyltransferase family protein [Gaiellaceae bacterium]
MLWRRRSVHPRPVFRDRVDAGRQLAAALTHLPEDAIIVGLARGGAVLAAEIASALHRPLDVLAVRKIRHPWQPEYAIGAVTPHGRPYVRGHDGLDAGEVDSAVASAVSKAETLDLTIHASTASLPVADKTCVLVDDGLATGATMEAAVDWAKQAGARHVVVAVPVGAPSTVATLRAEADEVVCLESPPMFIAVGLHYQDFGQVDDLEVVRLLALGRRSAVDRRSIEIHVDALHLQADLVMPRDPRGWVVFAHGSGSSRRSPRNVEVARVLNEAALGTVLLDLLTPEEELDRALVFDIELLAHRVAQATRWLDAQEDLRGPPVGLFGASTGAAAALVAAARIPQLVRAVVSRGGRPDLAGGELPHVHAPTLLIVGGADHQVLRLNEEAATRLSCPKRVAIVPGATHLFEEPGALGAVSELARDWFLEHLDQTAATIPRLAEVPDIG